MAFLLASIGHAQVSVSKERSPVDTTPARILIVNDSAHALRIISDVPKTEPKPLIDYVYLIPVPARSQAWYVNQYVRHAYEVRLWNVTNERACRTRQVEFVATQSGAQGAAVAAPSTKVNAEWVFANEIGTYCRATIHWRLGDVPGEQELVARLVRDDKAELPDSVVVAQQRHSTRWIASAHMVPTLVAGFSYALGANPPLKNPADSLLRRRGQPFFGVEFTPLFGTQPNAARVIEHVRITVGTSYRSPGFDFYVGLSPIALFDGLRTTGLPIQLTAGRRWSARGNDTYFVGGTVNALGLFSTIVGKL